MNYDREVKIERRPEDSTGDDNSIPGVENTNDNSNNVIFASYYCKIKERVSYKTGNKGDSLEGKAKMYGQPTKDIQNKDLVIDLDTGEEFKVIGRPATGKKHTISNVIRS